MMCLSSLERIRVDSSLVNPYNHDHHDGQEYEGAQAQLAPRSIRAVQECLPGCAFLAGIMLDCDPRRLAAARAKVSLLESAPGVWAICCRCSNRDAALALVHRDFSSYLGNADGYNFTAVVARR
jgi:hypothetical protein